MQPGEGNGKIYLGIPRERFYFPEFVDNRDKVLRSLHEGGLSCGYYQASGHRVDRNRDRIERVPAEMLFHNDCVVVRKCDLFGNQGRRFGRVLKRRL